MYKKEWNPTAMNAIPTTSFLLIDPSRLTVDPNNIRQTPNPAYRQIKESIRADRGTMLVFPVTRSDEQSPWIVVGGFGSRLRAAQELKQEWVDQDSNPFQDVRCLEVNLTGDFPQLLAGIRENTIRGDTSYAEICLAIDKSRQRWDDENRDNSSNTAFLAFLRESGISLSPATYSRMSITARNLLPLLPKWLLQGRASPRTIRLYIDFRASVTKAIGSPPDGLTFAVALNSSQASLFFDQHFEAIAPTVDSAELDWMKDLQRPMTRRLASALSISNSELGLLIAGKRIPLNEKATTTPVFNAFSETLKSASPQWDVLANELDVPTTFEGCLRALAQMNTNESSRFIGELKSIFCVSDAHVSSN